MEWVLNKIPTSRGAQHHAIPCQRVHHRGAQTKKVQRPGPPTLLTGDTDNTTPTWNTAVARLPAFLSALKRHDYLYGCTKGAFIHNIDILYSYSCAHETAAIVAVLVVVYYVLVVCLL